MHYGSDYYLFEYHTMAFLLYFLTLVDWGRSRFISSKNS